MARAILFAALAVCLAVGATANERYSWSADPGAFTVEHVEFRGAFDAPWQEGTVVGVEISGRCSKKITAGTLKYKLYESFVQHFESSGNLPYFKCNNKGCNVDEPVTLFLRDPNSDNTDYTLKFDYTMGAAQKTGIFSLVIWGVDQDHTPYDFSVSIDYNYTSGEFTTSQGLRGSAIPRPVVPELPAVPAPEHATTSLPFKYNVTNAAMTIDSVTATSSTGKWQVGAQVTVTMTGEIQSKKILAGTLKYKVYEMGVRYFIAEGNEAYFECTNKGCNPFDGIGLKLNNPTKLPTSFVATITVTLPRSIKGGRNPFNLLIWGVDQDHNPPDFTVSIDYDLVSGR